MQRLFLSVNTLQGMLKSPCIHSQSKNIKHNPSIMNRSKTDLAVDGIVGTGQHSFLSFIEKPQIVDIFTSSDTTKQEGDRVELKCNASGIPTPLITWQMSGGGVLPTGGRELTVSRNKSCLFLPP